MTVWGPLANHDAVLQLRVLGFYKKTLTALGLQAPAGRKEKTVISLPRSVTDTYGSGD